MKKIVAFVAVLALVSSASAEVISVSNASFEEPELAAGGWTNEYPGWQAPDPVGNAFVEYIDGFSADGNQHLGIESGAEVSQDLGVGLSPNSTYDLAVAIGHRDGYTSVDGTSQSTYGLYLGGSATGGGTLLATSTVNAGPIAAGTFGDFSMTYSTSESVPEGNLFLSLQSTGGGRAHYDDVRLSVVPEPSSVVLVCLAGLTLLTSRRRR